MEEALMQKFLIRNYPVRRVKCQKHFKRAIILENGNAYPLSNKAMRKSLYFMLLKNLTYIFDVDEKISKNILENFLHL